MHLLRKGFVDILTFYTTSLIKVTIKALIIPCCQWEVKIIFITNISFMSECVSVMIIGALTHSHALRRFCPIREALIAYSRSVAAKTN